MLLGLGVPPDASDCSRSAEIREKRSGRSLQRYLPSRRHPRSAAPQNSAAARVLYRCAGRLGRSVPLLPQVSIAAFAAVRSPCRAAVFRCAALSGRKIEIFLYSVVRSMKKMENDVILLLNPNSFREDEAHEIRNLLRLLGTGVDRRLFQVY